MKAHTGVVIVGDDDDDDDDYRPQPLGCCCW
jgi:hypothetical protein